MPDAKFPLVEKAGLGIHEVYINGDGTPSHMIVAHAVEALLANAPVVKCAAARAYGADGDGWVCETESVPSEGRTHTARLLMIEPIVRESEERQLLRKLVDIRHVIDMNQIQSIQESARALLAKGGGNG